METVLIGGGLLLIAISRKSLISAFGVLIFSIFIWPEFLRFPVGPIQMSVPRLLAIAILIKAFTVKTEGKVSLNIVDFFVFVGWFWTVIANIIVEAEFYQLSQMIGRFFDTVLIYYVAKIVFQKESNYKNLYFWLALTAISMAIAGIYEAVTWSSPYHVFNSGEARISGYSEIRYGFLRASASTQQSIYFGLAMVFIVGFIWGYKSIIVSSTLTRFVFISSNVACLTSLSSGPWLGLLVFWSITVFYYYPRLIKPALILLLLLIISIELLSNRHFYNLIDYFAIDKRTAWYRTRLLEVAVEHLHEYALFGYGSYKPHHWTAMIDDRDHIDIVNHYILIVTYGGLFALFTYIASHYYAIKYAIKFLMLGPATNLKRLVFSCVAIIISLDFSSMSVGLFGPPLILSHIVLGMVVGIVHHGKWVYEKHTTKRNNI